MTSSFRDAVPSVSLPTVRLQSASRVPRHATMSSSTARVAPSAHAPRLVRRLRAPRARARAASRRVVSSASEATTDDAGSSASSDAFALRASLSSSPLPLASLVSDPAARRAFDVVVWGATGFTGALVAAHLARHAPPETRWAIGGRDGDKLRALVGRLVDSGASSTLVPTLIGDAASDADMAGLAHCAACVVSAAGPYGALGGTLLGACASAGTHYADLTGEPAWVRSMIDRWDGVARASGATLVPCSGFDSVPGDVGAYGAARALEAATGAKAVAVTSYLTKVLGGFSGGTLATGWRLAEDARERATFGDLDLLVDEDVLARCREVSGDPTQASRDPSQASRDPPCVSPTQTPLSFAALEPTYDEDLRAWATTSPFAPCDAKIVRRSVALLTTTNDDDDDDDDDEDSGLRTSLAERRSPGSPYASLAEFSYEGKLAAFELGTPIGWLSAKATASALEAAARAATDANARASMKAALPKPGEGPPEWFRAAGFWEMRFKAEGANGEKTWSAMRGNGDPGYADTAKILAEVGLCLAEMEKEKNAPENPNRARGGVLTPACAFGDRILDRLATHGITFEVHGEAPRGVWF